MQNASVTMFDTADMGKIMNMILTPTEKGQTDLIYKHDCSHPQFIQVPTQDDYMCRYIKARDGNDRKSTTRQ